MSTCACAAAAAAAAAANQPPHQHGPGCGHTAIRHNGHVDYLQEGHLHHPHEGRVQEHSIAVSTPTPKAARPLAPATSRATCTAPAAATKPCRTATTSTFSSMAACTTRTATTAMTTAPWKLSRADPRLIAQASQRLSSRRRWLLSFRPRLRLFFAASSETCAPAPSSCGSFAPFPIAARARSTRTIVIFEADFSLFKRKQNPDERRRMRAGALIREPVQRLAVRGTKA